MSIISKQDLLEALRNGKASDDLANDLTNELNAAISEYKEEQAVADKRNKKIKDMSEITDLLHDYLIEYYADTIDDINTFDETFNEEMVENLVDTLDSGLELISLVSDFDFKKKKNKKVASKDIVDTEAAIKHFLKTFSL